MQYLKYTVGDHVCLLFLPVQLSDNANFTVLAVLIVILSKNFLRIFGLPSTQKHFT
jgi:hypothetical protein